ncbi:MAG: deoxyribodipyrimidine photo-lyase [Bacteroidales bacterium]|nr:deoxyribodipyrimidine photo-lyase [Bacteroidales bacterium]
MFNIFWFRRDLRLNDNHGLFKALKSGRQVLPLFIFDRLILEKIEDVHDARVQFIHQQLQKMNDQLKPYGTSILVLYGEPLEVFSQLISRYPIEKVFTNADYEPYGLQRDKKVFQLLQQSGFGFETYKDHVIMAPGDVLKSDGLPYTVFTPFSKRWKENLLPDHLHEYPSEMFLSHLQQQIWELPSLDQIGMKPSPIQVPALRSEDERIQQYEQTRNFPAQDGTTIAGPHLRFGTVSIRKLAAQAMKNSTTYLNELIWREFFMHIMFYFPQSEQSNFYSKYNAMQWRNNEEEFEKWCQGQTGYPMVDAGMRELAATGFMHNRVRMVVASFLTKHLLIDWRWGEAWFAAKLLDYELSSNVGNWQWAAGTGCDASPYFRVFNPSEQIKKFDQGLVYIQKWIPELNDFSYPKPIVDHAFARDRAIQTYKKALATV